MIDRLEKLEIKLEKYMESCKDKHDLLQKTKVSLGLFWVILGGLAVVLIFIATLLNEQIGEIRRISVEIYKDVAQVNRDIGEVKGAISYPNI